MNSGFKKTDISGSDPSNVEGGNTSELDKFFDNDSIKANQEMIEGVLNKAENKSLKEGFENFLSKEKNVVKKNAIKLKLSKATDELTVKSIIAEVVDGGYKIGDKKNVGEDMGKGENAGEGESIRGEKATEDQNGNLENNLQKAEEKEEKAEEKEEINFIDNNDYQKAEKIMEEAKEYLKNLVYKHPDLEAKIRPGTAAYENTKKLLEEQGIISKLKQDNHDEQFISNYILVKATLQEVNQNVNEYSKDEISTFDKIVKNLDNACNIVDTGLSSFDSKNISQTRTELFNKDIGNDSLISAKKSNMESHDYSKVFPEMGEDEMFIKYGKFLEGNLKNYWDQYKDNYLGFMDKLYSIREQQSQGKTLTDGEKEILSLPGKIKGIKENMDNDTKNMMEELCIISQIKGMFMCMGEGDDFDLNKANEIENENGVLTLRGHIDGLDFAIRQDTNNPEARLQTSQRLARSKDRNTFSIGGEDNFVDSNFILPSQKEIFESITETIQSDDSLSDFSNQDEYLEHLQSNIMGNMEEKYKKTEYVHHYMQGQVSGEKVIDNTLGLINKVSPNITNNETLMKGINQASNKDLYDFMKIIKFNTDNSTNDEKEKLNQCISRILEITDNYKNSGGIEDFFTFKYPPIIENYLKDKAWLNGGNEDMRLKSLSDLFKYYSEKSRDIRTNSEGNDGESSKMIINDLYRDLFESTLGGKSETASARNMDQKLKSNNAIAWQESQNADSSLKLDDTSLWPEG